MADDGKIYEEVGTSSIDRLLDTTPQPVNPLDAEQYSADDIDGVTESIFGSGNMSYASLQASQTDDAMRNDGSGLSLTGADAPTTANTNVDSTASQSPIETEAEFSEARPQSDPILDQTGASTDRPIGQSDGLITGDADISNGGFVSSTVGTVSAAQLSTTSGASVTADGGIDTIESIDGSEGVNGKDGDTPDKSSDGDDGNDGTGVVVEPNVDIDIDLGDTLEVVNNTVGDVGAVIENVITNVVDITNILQTIDVTNLTDLTEATNQVVNITETLTESVTTILNDVLETGTGPILTVDVNVLDSVFADVDVPLNALFDSTADVDINLTSLIDSAESVIAVSGLGIFEKVISHLRDAVEPVQESINEIAQVVGDFDPSAAANAVTEVYSEFTDTLDGLIATIDAVTEQIDDVVGGTTDTTSDVLADAALAIEQLVDVPLDGITDGLLGSDDGEGNDSDVTVGADIDGLDADLADPLADVVVDPLEDLVGDVDIDIAGTTDLLGDSETDNTSGDEDVTVQLDSDIIDMDIVSASADVPLDPVESLTGDIDLDVGAAVDVLGETADPVVNDGAGGTGEDSVLSDLGVGADSVVEEVIGATGTDLLGAIDSPAGDGTDSDVTLDTGVDALDVEVADAVAEVVIDPVETLLGDVDIDIAGATDLLGDSETDNTSGDQDVTVELDGDIIDTDIVSASADVPLDPVESLTGDIDLDVGAAVDVLGETADPVVNDGAGGTGEDSILSGPGDALLAPAADIENDIDLEIDNAMDLINASSDEVLEDSGAADDEVSWTDSTIDGAGGLFDDVVNGPGGDDEALPDPAATIGEGLGALNIDADPNSGSNLGLFG